VRFVVYGIFFNPLVIAIADWLAWAKLGLPTLVALLILPILVWATMGRDGKLPHRGLWNYLAGLQVFYASIVGGIWVIFEGVGVHNEYVIGLGLLLLLPAIVIGSLVMLS
jgi:hypothetical protein